MNVKSKVGVGSQFIINIKTKCQVKPTVFNSPLGSNSPGQTTRMYRFLYLDKDLRELKPTIRLKNLQS